MGKPAARAGDTTAHGTPLGPAGGSTNVLIANKPAWRATTDIHTCPLANPGPAPHVGGQVLQGSTTVFINDFPAVRMGDQIVESGPPNSITSGEMTVMIG